MVQKRTTIINTQGFHMRPAGIFAAEMGKFSSDIFITHNGQNVNAKSLMNIIAACIKCGSEVEIIANGVDEQAALDKAIELIESGLGE